MTSFVQAVVFVSMVGGAVAYVILAPNQQTPEKAWLKRTLLAGIFATLSFFCFALLLTIPTDNPVEYRFRWDSLSSILVLVIPLGVLFTLATYINVFLRAKYTNLLDKLIMNIKKRAENKRK